MPGRVPAEGGTRGRGVKNRPFRNRLWFALNGLKTAWRGEASFRFQCLAAAGLLGALCLARPGPVWWGVLVLGC